MARKTILTIPTTIFGKIAMALLFLPGRPSTGIQCGAAVCLRRIIGIYFFMIDKIPSIK
jgi:hypothetical protein